MGQISRKLTMRSLANGRQSQRSVLRTILCNVFINDLDYGTEYTSSKPVTDTKFGAGIECWRAGLLLRETRAGRRNKLIRNAMKMSKTKLFNLTWNKLMQPSKQEDNSIDPQRMSWGPGSQQVDLEPGMCPCSTEGQWHCGLYYQEHSQKFWGSGPFLHVALLRSYLECCSSGFPSSRKTSTPWSESSRGLRGGQEAECTACRRGWESWACSFLRR